MLLFVVAILWVVDRESYTKLIARAQSSRTAVLTTP